MAERSPVGYDISVKVTEFTDVGLPAAPIVVPNQLTIIDKPEQMGSLLQEWQEDMKTSPSCREYCEDCIENFLYFKETRHFVKVINHQDFFAIVKGDLKLNSLF